jgi:hypothetical protein
MFIAARPPNARKLHRSGMPLNRARPAAEGREFVSVQFHVAPNGACFNRGPFLL